MAEAIRRECDPVAFRLGFRHPRKGDWNRWVTTRRNVYIRWRGDAYDEVVLRWARFGGSRFTVSSDTSVVVDMLNHPDGPIREVRNAMVRASASVLLPPFFGQFGLWRSIPSVVALLNQCLVELDHWVRDDIAGPHVLTGLPYRVSPTSGPGWLPTAQCRAWGDPTRDPERDGGA
jgi:hypothetical protein